MDDTCVYLHTRSDGVVFYVGIGSPKRPYEDGKRNKHWHNTTNKYAYTVTLLHENLSWSAACALEIELIKKYRAISGDKLCNITVGGDGAKGVTHSVERKAQISASLLGRVCTSVTRGRLSSAHKGKSLSVEHRSKLRAAKEHVSPESRAKMRTAARNRSPETLAKLSAAANAIPDDVRARMNSAVSASNTNRVMSDATRAKLSLSQKVRREKERLLRLVQPIAYSI